MKISVFVGVLILTLTGGTAFAETGTFAGYLADQACGVQGKSPMDGSNLVKAPWDHTKNCAIACATPSGEKGYGLMVPNGATFRYVPFDQEGSKLAAKALAASKKKKGLTFVVEGVLDGNTLVVTAVKESNAL